MTDQLSYERLGDANKTYPASTLVIRKQYVDAAIAELQARIHELESIPHTDNSAVIERLSNENERLNKELTAWIQSAANRPIVISKLRDELRATKRALWLMTSEWAEGMGLASCNIAIKLSVKERFFYHDEANREKDIKKYRHRQVVFYKYADHCRAKAEEYK